jgi:hypothetical protein
MSTEIKHQNTLFRFVSLRNPELVRKEKIKTSFVLHPDIGQSIFQINVENDADSTKWESMKNTAVSFQPIQNEAMLSSSTASIYEQAVWLAENKNHEKHESYESLSIGNPIDNKLESSLWDNLFYQVVTEKDFYLKERLMQVLTYNNLLKYYKGTNNVQTEFNLPLFNELKNAQIVLPSSLFDEMFGAQKSTAPAPKPTIKVISAEQTAATVESARINIKGLHKLKTAISSLEKSYQKDYKRKYELALNNYDLANEPILKGYYDQVTAEKQNICKQTNGQADFDSYCQQPNVPYPDLPKFSFELEQPVDDATLQKALSVENFNLLNNIGAANGNTSFEEIFEKIELAIKNENETLIENTSFADQAMMIGGVLLHLKTTPPTLPGDSTLTPAFVPNRFGIRNIGIADYKKVVAHVCCYDAGEVSHIENIMAKEYKEKSTERIHKTTISSTTEQTKESEQFTDVSSTERFEMQTEIAKMLQEDVSSGATANMSYSGLGFSASLGANYATNTSREESNRQAVNYAKEITQKATEKIVSRLRSEKTVTVTDEFRELNKHGFDNTKGDKHVSGVYRFINAIYKNQIYNYGKRIMYEFMIPQPGKLHQLGIQQNESNPNTVFLKKPIDPRIEFPDANYINEYNYRTLASKYDADVNTFPEKMIYASKGFSGAKADGNELFSENYELPIPKGYFSTDLKLLLNARWDVDRVQKHSIGITVGNQRFAWNEAWTDLNVSFNSEFNPSYKLDKFVEKVGIAYQSLNYLTFNIGITIKCELTNEKIQGWKEDAFQAIIKGYETQLAKFNAQISDIQSIETNPGFYRQVENIALRKNCIAYLIEETQMGRGFYTGSQLTNLALLQNQQLDNYANLAKFIEQAFEWSLMSYNFYPFYWGDRTDWTALYQYECNDPLFRSFMQSGMARVIVTVRPGFEKAVLHFMQTGQIWNGGEVPVVGNPLYMSIVDELKVQEYAVEESWETVVPTNLIALQSSGVAVAATGLPCGEDCKNEGNPLKPNENTLSIKE